MIRTDLLKALGQRDIEVCNAGRAQAIHRLVPVQPAGGNDGVQLQRVHDAYAAMAMPSSTR